MLIYNLKKFVAVVGKVSKWLRAVFMAHAIVTIVVQNLLASFCCVLKKINLQTFFCLTILASSCNFQPYN